MICLPDSRNGPLLRLIVCEGRGQLAVGIGLLLKRCSHLFCRGYSVSPRDPLAFGSASAVMAIATLAGCFLPAWRAACTDPVRALRQ